MDSQLEKRFEQKGGVYSRSQVERMIHTNQYCLCLVHLRSAF